MNCCKCGKPAELELGINFSDGNNRAPLPYCFDCIDPEAARQIKIQQAMLEKANTKPTLH